MSKSTDGGLSWNRTSLSSTYPVALTLDEQDPRTLYVTTNPEGLFKSEDGGQRWNLLSTFAGGSLAIDARDRTILYMGHAVSGLYKSVDGGLTWTPRNQGLLNTRITQVAVSHDRTRLSCDGRGRRLYQRRPSRNLAISATRNSTIVSHPLFRSYRTESGRDAADKLRV